MAKYGSFKYGAEKYGVTASELLLWTFIVDWDGDGYYSGENEAQYMSGLTTERGREYVIQGDGQGLEPYMIGRATIIVDNDDGRYNPFNASSPLYPDVSPGKNAIIAVKYGVNNYGILYGKIADIQPFNDGNRKKCRIEIVDGSEFLRGKVLKIGYRGSYAFKTGYSAITSANWMNLILTETDWPWESDLDLDTAAVGNEVGYHYIRHGWFWLIGGLDGVKKLVDSEIGVFLHDRNGIAQFPVGYYTDVLILDESQVLRDISSPQPWEVVRNRVDVVSSTIQYFSEVPAVVVFEMGGDGNDAIPIAAGEYIDFSARFRYENLPLLVGGTGLTYNSTFTDADDGGAALGHTITLLSETADGGDYRVSNDTGTDGYLRLFQVEATVGGLLRYKNTTTVDDDDSIDAYGERALTIDTPFIQNTDRAKIVGDQILPTLTDAIQIPTIMLEDRPVEQFRPELYNTALNFNSDTLSIDHTLRIGKISHFWKNENGQSVVTTFRLEPDLTGTLPAQIEFTYLNDFTNPDEVDGAGPPPSGKMEWALQSPGWAHDTTNNEIYGRPHLGFARVASTVGLSEAVVAGMFIFATYRFSNRLGVVDDIMGQILLNFSVSGWKQHEDLRMNTNIQKKRVVSDELISLVYEIPATYIGENLTDIYISAEAVMPDDTYLHIGHVGLGVGS